MTVHEGISKSVRRLELNIEVAHVKIKRLQEECGHPLLYRRYQYGANTGNYDPHDDCYWTDMKCTCCQRMWCEEGSMHMQAPAVRVKNGESL